MIDRDGPYVETVETFSFAGNASYSYTADQYRREKVIVGRITVVCDATVANRYPYFVYRDSGNNIVYAPPIPNVAMTAGQTKYVDLVNNSNQCSYTDRAVTASQQNAILDVPDLWLEGSDGLRMVFACVGGVAGDTVSVRLVVKKYMGTAGVI